MNAQGAGVGRGGPEALTRPWFGRLGRTMVLAVKDFVGDNGPQWAAAVAYYALLSVFPLLLAAASVAAYVVAPEVAIREITNTIGEFLPMGEGQIEEVVQGAIEARGTVGLLSFLGLLWSGTRVLSVLTRALNITFDADDSYGFLKRTLVELAMLVTIGALFAVAIVSRYVIPLAWGWLGLPGAEGALQRVATFVIPSILLLLALTLTYRFVPRRRPDIGAAFWGAFLASTAIIAARPLFGYYIQRFANYNLIYGPLAVVIILVLWAYILALITLFGGEVASHVQMVFIEDLPLAEVQRRHEARSPRVQRPEQEQPSAV